MPDSWEDEDDDWEADGIDEKLKLDVGKKGDDEAWSDEEGHDAHKQEDPAPVVAPPKKAPPKEKSHLEKKIEERERREKEEAERKALMRKDMGEASLQIGDDVDEATAEKLRRRHEEEAADLDNAIDLMGAVPTAPPKAPAQPAVRPQPKAAEGTFEAFEPVTDADFDQLAKMISVKLATFEGTKGHMKCLKSIVRAAAEKMSTEDAKDLSSMVSVVYNDKVKADRDKDKKGKPKGKAGWGAKNSKVAGLGAGNRDDHDLDDIGSGGGAGWGGGGGGRDDDYDFM